MIYPVKGYRISYHSDINHFSLKDFRFYKQAEKYENRRFFFIYKKTVFQNLNFYK